MANSSRRAFKTRRKTHDQSLTFVAHTECFLALALPLKCVGEHLISNANPQAIIGPPSHGTACPGALLGLFANNPAEVLPAHESQSHARNLAIADSRSRLQGLLKKLLRLNGRLGMHGSTDQKVGGPDVLVWTVLAE